MPTYLTCYIRLDIDPDTNLVYLYEDATYFGGLYHNHSEAEHAARDCVNTTWEGLFAGKKRGDTTRGLILPRVFTQEEGETLIDTLYRAQGWFEKKLAEMNETAATLACS